MTTQKEPRLLSEATVQEIQLELIRRSQYNAFDGKRIYASLMAHRDLWEAAILDRCGVAQPDNLPMGGLIKLRDLPGGFWNADTLYLLVPDVARARQLAELAEREDWGGEVRIHENESDRARALGTSNPLFVVSVWWD